MDKPTKNKIRKKLQRFLKTTKKQNHSKMIDKIIKNTQTDLLETLPRLEKLRKEIKPLQGRVRNSKLNNYIKISQPLGVGYKASLEFYDICKRYERKHGLEFYYNPNGNVFYLK